MSFDIDGAVQTVYSCDSCGWCQIEKHFASGGDGLRCTMCNSPATAIDEITERAGMSDFRYRQLLDELEENASGVGSATVESIEQHFEDGDDFLDAVEAAYQEIELAELEAVDGVGTQSAKEIATTVAAHEDWDNGALFVM
jgi:hypothetical protein